MLKYKMCILFLSILFIYSFNFVYATNKEPLLIGKIIYIDAGHGGISKIQK